MRETFNRAASGTSRNRSPGRKTPYTSISRSASVALVVCEDDCDSFSAGIFRILDLESMSGRAPFSRIPIIGDKPAHLAWRSTQ